MKQKAFATKFFALAALLLALVFAMPFFGAYAEEEGGKAPEEQPKQLHYNAEENFSDLGSDFWNYYFINEDEGSQLTEMEVHGGGLQSDAAYDGTTISCYKYVVGDSDFISDEYHQYLGIWGGISMHPGGKADVVLSFIAPVDGVIDISANVKQSSDAGDGVRLYTTLNDLETNIYPYVEGEDCFFVQGTDPVVYSVQGVSVKRGDEIFFRLNRNETLANDNTYFSPTVTYTSYTMPSDVSVIVSDTALRIPVGGIRLLDTDISVNLGQTLTYTFVSTNEAVATVKENGLIYAVGEGETTINVTETGTGLTAACTVTVVANEAAAPGDGGSDLPVILGVSIGGVVIVAAVVVIAVVCVKKKKKV